jgi:hypothetical protein
MLALYRPDDRRAIVPVPAAGQLFNKLVDYLKASTYIQPYG